MPTLLPCGSVSSPLIQKWKENIRTPEVLLKQRCSTSIKTRKEKKLLFLKLKFHFLTNSQLLVKCRGPLWAAPALRQLEVVQTVCTWPEVLDFHCSFRFQHYGDWERLEVMISWHRDCFSPSCCSHLFISSHFLSVYLWLSESIGISLCTGKIHYLPWAREGAESRLTNRSEDMFVSASLFLGARDSVAIYEIFIVLETSGQPC